LGKKTAWNFKDRCGERYGRLVAEKYLPKSRKSAWVCRCDCGNYAHVFTCNLASGKQVSCGCVRDEVRRRHIESRRVSEERKRERARARNRKYYYNNRDRLLKEQKERYWNDPIVRKAVLESSKNWRAKNKEHKRILTNKRRALIKINGDGYTPGDIREKYWLQKVRCAACEAKIKDRYEIDHIIPVSKGGANDRQNIQLLCPECNRKKSDKLPHEYMRKIGKLL